MSKMTQRNVPEIRFKGFGEDWDRKILLEIAEIKTGPFGSMLHAKDYVLNGIPIITTEHFKHWHLPNSKKGLPQVSSDDYIRLKNYTLKLGDLVFSRVGSIDINANVQNNQNGWLFSGRVLRVRTTQSVDSEYLHHELSTNRARRSVAERAVGQTMPSINTQILGLTPIFLSVNSKEQTQIGSYFKELDRMIGLHQRKHDKLLTLKQAMLQKMFPKPGNTTPEIRFKGFSEPWVEEVLDKLADVRDGTHESPKYQERGKPLITSKNVRDGWINYNDIQYISDRDYYDINKRSKVHTKDILMGMIGTIGNIALIRNEPDFAIKNVALIKYTGRISELYLYQYFQTKHTTTQLKESSEGGTQKFISLNKIRNLMVSYPSHEEQQKIGTYFRNLDDLISKHSTQLTKLKNIKAACLEKMFV